MANICININEIQNSSVYYPETIVRGCANLDEGKEFSEMPDGYIRIVMRLIKKIDLKNPEKAIFARRSTLAKESGKSEVTINRALKWLEEQGMITRSQKCKMNLKGSDSPITPTKRFLTAIGLDRAPAIKNDSSISRNKKHNINKQSDGNSENKRQTTVIQGAVLPNDLVWLIKDGGLSAAAVLKLMKIASKSGKRLSDVVAVTKQWLEKLEKQGNILFAYLCKLIKQDKDYTFIAKQADESRVEKRIIIEKKQELEKYKAKFEGKTFKSSSGQCLIVKTGFIDVYEGSCLKGSRCLDMQFIEAVISGKVQELQ